MLAELYLSSASGFCCLLPWKKPYSLFLCRPLQLPSRESSHIFAVGLHCVHTIGMIMIFTITLLATKAHNTHFRRCPEVELPSICNNKAMIASFPSAIDTMANVVNIHWWNWFRAISSGFSANSSSRWDPSPNSTEIVKKIVANTEQIYSWISNLLSTEDN